MAQHTCTGCVPIDAKIIDVYIQLLGLKDSTIEAAERAEYAAEHAIGKSPYIGENGDWWEWNDEQGVFIDTGVQAQSSIAVDTAMSSTSTNPVQNKVITAAVNGKQDALVSGTNIKTVNGESLLGSGNIIAGDPNAVKYVEQTLTDSQKTQARSNIGAGTYSKAGSGIPKSDLSSAVQTSLGKADTAIQDISGKQDVITDLATIRSGAAAGATAYQKPASGVPASDMASGVQTSLGKADTAYQKPGSGVPKTDLESGVQASLDLADSAIQARPMGEIDPTITPADYATKEELDELEAEVDENREELDNINLKVTGRIGVANSNADIDPEDLPEYTGQYGQVTLTVSGDAYLWVCLENESFRLTANGIDIPMVYVKEDGGLHCYVSAEKIKAGALVFDITNLHPIKADGERVVITARSYTITYGDAMPDFGYIADGQVEGTPAISCDAVQGSDAGTYAINIARGTVVDDNCIYVPGVLTIEKAELTVTAEDKQVAVGGTMPAFTVQYSGFVLGEDAGDLTTVPTCTTDAEDTDTEGNYTITPAGGVATNYSFVYVPGVLTVGEPVILTLSRADMFASGSCGGFIDLNDGEKYKNSTTYYGILIDVQRYRGLKVTVTKGSNSAARIGILKSKTLTNNTKPTFSTATGFTGLMNRAWGTGETEFEFTIPSDAVVMYVYVYNSSYATTPMCHTMEIHGVPEPAVMKNLTADMFATNTTIGNDGTVYTGSSAPTSVCSGYLNTNNYCRLGKASFIKNAYPVGVEDYQVNIAEYDPNQIFIKRESYKSIPHEYTLAPSCKFIRVMITCRDGNGDNMSGDTIRFDNDDIQVVGLENL